MIEDRTPHGLRPSLGWQPANLPRGSARDWERWLVPPPAHPAFAGLSGRPAAALPAAAPAAARCQEGLADLFARRPQSPPGRRIETDRLVLRVLREDDFVEYAAMLADPATFRFSERGAMSADEAWTRLLRHVGHWSLMGWGLFAIEEKATGRFVGEAGLGDFRRELGADYDGVPESAWTIARWARGRGYATEAMGAALDWTEQRLAAPRSVCLIHVDNAASIRVAAKLGYRRFAECTYRDYEALLFARDRT